MPSRLNNSPGNAMANGSTSKAFLRDVLTIAAVFACLFAHLVAKSPQKLFWHDEILTAVVVHDQPFTEIFASLQDTINAMPPTYFVGVWLWTKLFGVSDLALRSYSTFCLFAAWVLCWYLLRYFCDWIAATTATTITFFCSDTLLHHSVEARCYPQFVAVFFAIGLLFVICWSRPKRPGPFFILAIALAHAILVTTHYVGCVYSGAMILAAALIAGITRHAPLKTYVLAAAAGTLTAALCIPFYLAQKPLGGADNALTIPDVKELVAAYYFGQQASVPVFILVIAVTTCGVAALLRLRQASSFAESPAQGDAPLSIVATNLTQARRAAGVYLLCAIAIAVPAGIWIESQVGIRLFVDRYLLPSILVWPCLLAVTLSLLQRFVDMYAGAPHPPLGSVVAKCPWACSAVLIAYSLVFLYNDAAGHPKKVQLYKRYARVADENDVIFASAHLTKVLAVRHFGARGLFIYEDGQLIGNERITVRIASSLDRRYWPGLFVSAMSLDAQSQPLLMLDEEWDTLRKNGLLPESLQVVKRLEEFVIVSPGP